MAAPMKFKKGVGDYKIAKKRKNLKANTDGEKNTHSPEKHKSEDTFTELEFKLSLRDSNTTFSGFEKFIVECEKWPAESDYDLVAGYCRSSPECAEIFQVLDAGKRKVPELHLIFWCLEKILLRIADDLDVYHSVGQAIVKKLLATQIGAVFFTLRSSNKSSHIKTSLKLLVAMVMLGSSSAKSVLTRVDLANPCIKALFNRRDTKDEEDVRTCLTHLIVAFLLSGDNETIRKLASTKDCLANMFHGVVFDRVATVQLILSTVMEKIVKNPTVSKTSKVHIFTETSLKQLAMLYSWKGPSKWKESQAKGHKVEVEMDSDPSSDQRLLAETVTIFLTEVCTSVKYGIVFVDKSYGISGKNQNHTLTSFLSYLSTLSQNALGRDLIVKVLAAAPDQTRHFLPHLTHSLAPRPTDKWVNNMKFLNKVYEAQPTVPHVLRVREARTTERLVEILMVYTTPTPQVLNTFLPGLKNKSCSVWYTCLQMVKLLAERAVCILKVLSDHGPESTLAAVYSADELTDIVDAYRDTVLKSLPESLTIFQCWDKAQELQGEHSDITVKQLAELQDLCGASVADTRVCIEQVLCLYQDLVPSLLTDHPVGLGKLLDGVVSEGADRGQSGINDQGDRGDRGQSDGQVLSQMYLLKLLAGTDARRIPWGKESQSGQTLMYQLLGMVAQVTDTKLGLISLQLMCKLLESTGLFDNCLDELAVWMGQLQVSMATSSAPDVLLGYVAKVFMGYMNNPFPYMSQVADIVSETVAMETHGDVSSGQNIDAFIQDILSTDSETLDDSMATSESDTSAEDKDPTRSPQRYPFCPVLCTAMDLLQKSDSPDVCHYMSSVTLRLFHLQNDPRPLCLFIKSVDSATLVDGLQPFLLSWLPGGKVPKKCPKKMLPLCDKFTSQLIRRHYGERVSIDAAPDHGGQDRQATVKACLLYVQYYLSQETQNSSEDGESKLGPILAAISGALRQPDGHTSVNEGGMLRENTKLAAEFTQLQPKLMTHSEQLGIIVRDILDHECMQKCFRAVFSGQRSAGHELQLTLCEMVVQTLNDVFNIAHENSLDLEDTVRFYTSTVVDAVKSVSSFDADETMANGTILRNTTVLNSLKHLITFMNTENCIDILEGVLAIPGDTFTSDTGVLVKYVLRKIEIHDHSKIIQMDETCLNNLLLYVADNVTDTDLAGLVLRVFRAYPNLAVLCSKDTFVNLLNKAESGILELASLLITHNIRLCVCASEAIATNRMKYLPLAVTLVAVMPSETAAGVKLTTGVAVADLYTSKIQDLCKDSVTLTQDRVDSLSQLFRALLCRRLIGEKTLKKMIKLLHQTFEDKTAIRCHHVKVIATIQDCLATDAVTDAVTASNPQRTELLHLSVKALGKCMELKTSRDVQMETQLLDILSTFTEDEVKTLRSTYFSQTDTWPQFIKLSLKYLYKDARMLTFLIKLIKALYTEDESPATVTMETIVSMVISHSSFLPVMFNEESPDAKEPLLDLLLELVERSPVSCQHDHVGVFLGSYGCTLSIVDQKILKLLQVYEKNGVDFTDYKPYLWGEKAVEHHALRKSLGPSLLKQPRMSDVIANLQPHTIQRTILNFPLRRKLHAGDPVEASEYKSEPGCYDPCFILPLFSHLLTPGSLVDCRKFVDRDCLGLTIAALSSHDRHMRNAAYHILDLYKGHLAGARFLEKEQIDYLLGCLRNSVAQAGNKLSCIVTVFLARVVKIMLKPDDHMYGVLNTFLLLKPSMDVLNVPEFYKLFNSSDLEFKTERMWMLTLLLDGLRETADYRLYEKRYTFKLLQSYYGSDLADVSAQLKVLQIVAAACKEKSIAMDLWRNHGIIVWLTGVIQKLSPDMSQHMAEVIQIVNSLWFSVLGKREYSSDTTSDKTRCLPPMFTGQMLSLVQSIVWYLRDIPQATMQVFVDLLYSMLKHVQHTTSVLETTNTTLNIRGLTPGDVMVLLFHAERYIPANVSATSFLNVILALGFSTEKLVQPKTVKYMRKNATDRRELTQDVLQTSQGAQSGELSAPGVVNTGVTSNVKKVDNVGGEMEGNAALVSSDDRYQCSDQSRPSSVKSEKHHHCLTPVNTEFLKKVLRIVFLVDLNNSQRNTVLSTPEHCACVLLIVKWMLGWTSQLNDVHVLTDISIWVQKYIVLITEDDIYNNTLAIQTLSQSSELSDNIFHGLIQLYSELETLVARSDDRENAIQNAASKGIMDDGQLTYSGMGVRTLVRYSAMPSVNGFLLRMVAERLGLENRMWQDFYDSQGEITPDEGFTEEVKSVLLRRYFLRKPTTVRTSLTPTSPQTRVRKRKAEGAGHTNKRRRSLKKKTDKGI